MASPPGAGHGAPDTNSAARQQLLRQESIFKEIFTALDREATRASRTGGNPSRYRSVHVLQVRWEDDDLGVGTEVDCLADVFEKDYNFQVEQFTIPVERSLRFLSRTVSDWADSYDHDDVLLILYYAGHGRISDSGRTVIWYNRRSRGHKYGELRWTGCDEILHEAAADKLFIFDCCSAASAISARYRGGASETICASGFESIAPPPGPHSFTTALVFVLRQMAPSTRPFSVSALHSMVLAYLKELDPRQISADGFRIADARDHLSSRLGAPRPEYRRTPIHFVQTHHRQAPGIQLYPLAREEPFIVMRENCPADKEVNLLPTLNLKVRPAGELTEMDVEAMQRWIRLIPIPTEHISVEAFDTYEAEIAVGAGSSEAERMSGSAYIAPRHVQWSMRMSLGLSKKMEWILQDTQGTTGITCKTVIWRYFPEPTSLNVSVGITQGYCWITPRSDMSVASGLLFCVGTTLCLVGRQGLKPLSTYSEILFGLFKLSAVAFIVSYRLFMKIEGDLYRAEATSYIEFPADLYSKIRGII